MKTNGVSIPAPDGSPVMSRTSDVGFPTRQRECMRAFQSGRSWYDAYWYPEHQPRQPAAIRRTLSTLVLLWESWAAPRPPERIGEPTLVLR